MSKKVIVEKQEMVFNSVFRIKEVYLSHERYDGAMSPRLRKLCFERGDSVASVIYHTTKKVLIFTEQFRYPTYEKGPGWIKELVAGSLKSDEDPKEGMLREIEEELGYKPLDIKEICSFYVSPGGSSERIILFYAEVNDSMKISSGGGIISENEDIKIIEMPLDASWDFHDAKTLIGIFWFFNLRESPHQ